MRLPLIDTFNFNNILCYGQLLSGTSRFKGLFFHITPSREGWLGRREDPSHEEWAKESVLKYLGSVMWHGS